MTRNWFSGMVCALLLAGCGGGGGGGDSGSGGGGVAGSSYTFQTDIFSPVSSQASGLASLNHPRFMAFNGSSLYVAGGSDNQVVRIGADGVQTTMTGFANGPVGVVIASNKLYVTQSDGLYTLDLSTLSLTSGASNAVSPTALNTSPACNNCLGLLLNSSTNVLYAARGTAATSLFTYNLGTNATSTIGLSPSTAVTGMAWNNTASQLYATDYSQTGASAYGVNVFTASSSLTYLSNVQIGNQPYAVAVASNGDVYVSNYAGNTVTRVHGSTTPTITTFLDATQVCHPTGLAIQNGYLYVANEPGCTGQTQSRGYIRRATIDLS